MDKFKEIREKYKALFLEDCVCCGIERKYGNPDYTFPSDLFYMLSYTVDSARDFILKKDDMICTGLYGVTVKDAMTTINQGLGEAGEKPAEFLPKVWEGSFEKELLDTAFWALTFMDEKVRHRARVAWYLDENKVAFGLSGYSEKYKMFISNYFTIFDDYVFYINPIQGKVYRSKDRVYDSPFLRKEGKKLYKGKTLIAEEDDYGVLTFYIEKQEKAKDFKEKEKEKKRAAGKKVKNTEWLTTNLGHMFGHNCNIRSHTFIVLMVMGFDKCKFSCMENNSILSIDHTIPQHNCNKLDNLALTSRSKNNSKKAKIISIFDYFLYFMGMDQVEVQVEEVSEEKDAKNDIPEWLKEPTKEEWDEFIAYHNRPLTADEIAEMFDGVVVVA